jgi:hypothetical protein
LSDQIWTDLSLCAVARIGWEGEGCGVDCQARTEGPDGEERVEMRVRGGGEGVVGGGGEVMVEVGLGGRRGGGVVVVDERVGGVSMRGSRGQDD